MAPLSTARPKRQSRLATPLLSQAAARMAAAEAKAERASVDAAAKDAAIAENRANIEANCKEIYERRAQIKANRAKITANGEKVTAMLNNDLRFGMKTTSLKCGHNIFHKQKFVFTLAQPSFFWSGFGKNSSNPCYNT